MTKEYILNFLTTHKKEMQEAYALTKIRFCMSKRESSFYILNLLYNSKTRFQIKFGMTTN